MKAELQREKKRHPTYDEIVSVLDNTYKTEWGQRKVREDFKKRVQRTGESMTEYFEGYS